MIDVVWYIYHRLLSPSVSLVQALGAVLVFSSPQVLCKRLASSLPPRLYSLDALPLDFLLSSSSLSDPASPVAHHIIQSASARSDRGAAVVAGLLGAITSSRNLLLPGPFFPSSPSN